MPPNVYRLDATPAVETPALSGSRNASVAIIGGGIVGLATALHLADAGVDTVVLESQEPGWGASGNNGGQLNPGLKFDPETIEQRYGPHLGRRMVAFAYDTPNRTLALIAEKGIACEARQNGTLRVAHGERASRGIRATAAQCMARDMPVHLLDREGIAEATGTDRYRIAMLDRRGGDLNPLSYVRGLARAAIAAGAAVHARTPARSLSKTTGAWSIETPSGTIQAEKVLIATNGFTDDLWPGLRQTIVPVFSAIAATEPLPSALASRILPARASVYESGRITVYFRVDANNRLLIGGRGPMRPISAPGDIAYLVRYAQRLWPELADVRWTHGWNSQLAMTQDHWPHIHEPAAGILAYLGCNGRGVALGTAIARQLADRLMKGSGFEMDLPIVSLKTIRFHTLWPLAVRSAVLHGRLMDRLGL
jgi:glycine/D-amino acid oxidase-like deaminating enzyme